MNRIYHNLLVLLIVPTLSMADCSSSTLFCYQTKFGTLDQITRVTSGDDYSYLTLNGAKIYKAKTSYMAFINDYTGFYENNKYFVTKTIFTYTSYDPCSIKDYPGHCSVSVVLDFSGDKPVISNEFTPDSGNSVIDWVSWGKANSIIVFDDESKFKYMNGHAERVTK